MRTILGLLLTLLVAAAADVTLTWDFNDPLEQVTAYRIYEVQGSTYTLVATVPGTTNIVTISGVQPGRRTYVATATNYWGESGYSNEAKTPAPGQPPKNLTVEK